MTTSTPEPLMGAEVSADLAVLVKAVVENRMTAAEVDVIERLVDRAVARADAADGTVEFLLDQRDGERKRLLAAEAKVAAVEALADRWEHTPALRRGTCATAIRAALDTTATEEGA